MYGNISLAKALRTVVVCIVPSAGTTAPNQVKKSGWLMTEAE